MDFDLLFNPQSIAVIGASRSKDKVGFQILNNLVRGGFTGKIYPVNPHAQSLLGLKTYPSISSLPDHLDLAVFAIPKDFLLSSLSEAGQKKLKFAVIITSGFKETGKEGAYLEKSLLEIAQRYNIRILGPNCLGILSSINHLNLSFTSSPLKTGNVSFVSQSGALGSSFLDWSEMEDFGFSHFVSLGNKSDINENELLSFFASHSQTRVIALYLESLQDGRELIGQAKKITPHKPVIIFKAGKTPSGKSAVSSHTGAMAGSLEAFRTAIAESGIIEATTLESFFDLIKTFSRIESMTGPNIAVITNGGGPGAIAVDSLSKSGLSVNYPSKETVNLLKAVLPPYASFSNPIDILGDADSVRYRQTISALLTDEDFDALLILITPQGMTDAENIAREIEIYFQKRIKPIIVVLLGGQKLQKAKDTFESSGIPSFYYPENAILCLQKLHFYFQHVVNHSTDNIKLPLIPDKVLSSNVLSQKLAIISASDHDRFIPELLSLEILSAYGIPIPETELVSTLDQAFSFLQTHSNITLKISSATLAHRVKAQGIKLNLTTKEQVQKAFSELSVLEGSLIAQQMVGAGLEVIIGVKVDLDFGHILMFGTGGTHTEDYRDISFATLPLTGQSIDRLINSTVIGKILSATPYLNSVVKSLLAVGKIIENYPAINELTINPLIISDLGSTAVDVKIKYGA